MPAVKQKFTLGELTCYLPVLAVCMFTLTCVGYFYALKMGSSHNVDNAYLQYAVAVAVFCVAQWWNWALSILVTAFSTDCYADRKKKSVWILFFELALLGLLLCCNMPFVAGEDQARMFQSIQSASQVDIRWVSNFNNAATAVAVIGIVFSLCTLAANYNMRDAARGADSVQLFSLSLYSAAAFLATGIFEIYSLFGWGWSLEHCGRSQVCDLNPGDVATCAGILFSALLVIMYLPTAIVMDRRMKSLYRQASGPEQQKGFSEWAMSAGLPTSPIKAISSYGAVLLPFATGLLAKVLQLHDLAH